MRSLDCFLRSSFIALLFFSSVVGKIFDEDVATSFRSGITVGDDGCCCSRRSIDASTTSNFRNESLPLTTFFTGDIDTASLFFGFFFFVGSAFSHSSSSSTFSSSASRDRPLPLDADDTSSKYFGNFAPKSFATLAPSVKIRLSSFVNMSGSSMRSNFFSIDSVCIFFTRSRKSSSLDGSSESFSSSTSSLSFSDFFFSIATVPLSSSFTFKMGVLNTSSSSSSATKTASFVNVNSTCTDPIPLVHPSNSTSNAFFFSFSSLSFVKNLSILPIKSFIAIARVPLHLWFVFVFTSHTDIRIFSFLFVLLIKPKSMLPRSSQRGFSVFFMIFVRCLRCS
mmetsp:Transcript_2657/g.8499  ORF Transcript_2657/g.8499 Transcript_2657/m.8499 type:complete len:337 (-) Transcript_2657:223-1233(-)